MSALHETQSEHKICMQFGLCKHWNEERKSGRSGPKQMVQYAYVQSINTLIRIYMYKFMFI